MWMKAFRDKNSLNLPQNGEETLRIKLLPRKPKHRGIGGKGTTDQIELPRNKNKGNFHHPLPLSPAPAPISPMAEADAIKGEGKSAQTINTKGRQLETTTWPIQTKSALAGKLCWTLPFHTLRCRSSDSPLPPGPHT